MEAVYSFFLAQNSNFARTSVLYSSVGRILLVLSLSTCDGLTVFCCDPRRGSYRGDRVYGMNSSKCEYDAGIVSMMSCALNLDDSIV